jgi:cytochrome c biogenesis protein CcmG, thiol:disulfide interchange protein DsbE
MRSSIFTAFLCCTVLAAARADSPADSPVDIAGLRGRVVYLDFWASWCLPCKQSFPWMQRLNDAYQAEGLSILAVNLDADRADADKFLRRFHPTFDVRFDPRGTSAEHYGVKGMPSSLLIDRRGVTRFTHVGFTPADASAAESQVRALLEEK